jgi:hypothetical protein
MRPSLARYFFATLAPIAFAVNFVCNALAGWLVFRGRPVEPSGLRSDALITGFVVALITALLTLPGARREVWAGRVPGFGIAPFRWLNSHPLLFALPFSLLLATAWTDLAMRTLEGNPLSSTEAIFFKALFASTVGVLSAWISALIAIAPERAPEFVAPPPPRGAHWPLDYFDKGALSVTDASRGCSGVLTWQLRVEGAIAADDVRGALRALVLRYPQLSARVEALDGVAPWASKYRYAQAMKFSVAAIFQTAEAVDSGQLETLRRREINRPFDPLADFPVTLLLVRVSAQESHLFFRMHHMIADGHAFIDLLGEFSRFLNHAQSRTQPALEALAPIPRRGDLAPLPKGLARIFLTLRGLGWLVRKGARNTLRPLTPLLQNKGLDYSGEDGSVHWLLDDSILGDWQVAREKIGVSLNSFLTGALLEALSRWHRASRNPLGRTVASLLVETRPREGNFSSFANHLGMLEVSLDLAKARTPTETMQLVQREVERQRAAQIPAQRIFAERLFVLPMPLGDLQRIVFEPKQLTSNLYFSNMITLPFPEMKGDGWRVSEVLLTSPVAPRTGIIVTVLRYGGKLVFNFNYKSSAASREEAQAWLEQLKQVLVEQC